MTTETTPTSRFVELDSKDPVVRFWANKAVQVLDNPELSEQGRAREAVVAKPIKKVRLPPRSQKA